MPRRLNYSVLTDAELRTLAIARGLITKNSDSPRFNLILQLESLDRRRGENFTYLKTFVTLSNNSPASTYHALDMTCEDMYYIRQKLLLNPRVPGRKPKKARPVVLPRIAPAGAELPHKKRPSSTLSLENSMGNKRIKVYDEPPPAPPPKQPTSSAIDPSTLPHPDRPSVADIDAIPPPPPPVAVVVDSPPKPAFTLEMLQHMQRVAQQTKVMRAYLTWRYGHQDSKLCITPREYEWACTQHLADILE